ncbi:MAG: cardiolipin synthase [Verrucomicrobiales bacterium]
MAQTNPAPSRVPCFRRASALLVSVGITALTFLLIFNLSTSEKKLKYLLQSPYATGDEQFVRAVGQLLGPPLAEGNRVKAFMNGKEIFPAMLKAIRSAEQSITFETYIYWSGEIGKQFAEALSERAHHGAKVHVLLDWAGSAKIEKAYLDKMRDAGVEVEQFHPIRWYTLSRLNNRTHRKLLVVDGKIGFTGGVGIADNWTGDANDAEHWRDSHYQIEGPAVAQMQAAFMDNWIKVRGVLLDGEKYFPPLRAVGGSLAQVFKSSRDEGSESVRLMYLLSIASARQSIRLAAAYFVPDDLAVEELVKARHRGVLVDVVVPGPIMDAQVVQKASRARWGRLIEAGISIFEYQPTMYHCKVLIVDDQWVSVGSTNFDTRSFRLNAEANLNILDREFALEQAGYFEADKARSHLMTAEKYARRPMTEKLGEKLSELLRSQL